MSKDSIKKANKPVDLTGRDRLMWNTIVSWVSHFALIVSGFIMPRLMDHHVGQAELGIWDFCWSFVNYVTLVGLGIGPASNRYVARYRAEAKHELLGQLISTVSCMQFVLSGLVVVITFIFSASLSRYFSDTLNGHVDKAAQVVIYLGLSLAMQFIVGISRGIITGFHRWDIHNALHAGTSLVSLVLMMSVLINGGGVVGMSKAYLTTTVVFESLRALVAYRLCRSNSIKPGSISAPLIKETFIFGAKSMFADITPVLLLQSTNILIATALGPAALAVMARPMALLKHISTFINKYTMILTPTVGSMQVSADRATLNNFYIESTKYSFVFSLPFVIFLALFGDLVILAWMGERYANWTLIATLAIGNALPIGQDASMRILMGMNMHGRVSTILFICALVMFGICYFVLTALGWSINAAALLYVVPFTVVYGVVLPYFACLKLEVPLRRYLSQAIFKPLIYVTPFLLLLTLAKILYLKGLLMASILLFLTAWLVLLLIYFKFVLPTHIKSAIYKKITRSR